jgi:hypothetical protein
MVGLQRTSEIHLAFINHDASNNLWPVSRFHILRHRIVIHQTKARRRVLFVESFRGPSDRLQSMYQLADPKVIERIFTISILISDCSSSWLSCLGRCGTKYPVSSGRKCCSRTGNVGRPGNSRQGARSSSCESAFAKRLYVSSVMKIPGRYSVVFL